VVLLNGFQKKTQKTPAKEIERAKKMKNQYYEDQRNNVVDFEEFIDKEFGNRGTKRREKFEEGYEAFKPGVMLQEIRKKNMTQKQLAENCGTTKNYISRIEKDAIKRLICIDLARWPGFITLPVYIQQNGAE
jgi:DNA-binding XRE family transcriptional regulator